MIEYVGDSFSITAVFDSLESKALARSVIEPSVLTLSGEQASIRRRRSSAPKSVA